MGCVVLYRLFLCGKEEAFVMSSGMVGLIVLAGNMGVFG